MGPGAGPGRDCRFPPTIHALLAARLDQLPDEERSVVDPASVIGLVFPQAALESMVEDDVRPEIRPIWSAWPRSSSCGWRPTSLRRIGSGI